MNNAFNLANSQVNAKRHEYSSKSVRIGVQAVALAFAGLLLAYAVGTSNLSLTDLRVWIFPIVIAALAPTLHRVPWHRMGKGGAYAATLTAMASAGVLVYLTGGPQSPFAPAYFVVAIFCAYYYRKAEAYLLAGLCVASYLSGALLDPAVAALGTRATWGRVLPTIALIPLLTWVSRSLAAEVRRETRRVERLRRLSKDVRAFNQILEAITSSRSLIEVLQVVSKEVVALTGVRRVSIWLLDPERQVLRMAAESNAGAEPSERNGQHPTPALSMSEAGSPVVAAVASRQTVKAGAPAPGAEYEPQMAVPLTLGAASLGAILLEEPSEDSGFTREECQRVEAIAKQATVAIENARRHESLEEVTRNLRKVQTELVAKNEELRSANINMARLNDELTFTMEALEATQEDLLRMERRSAITETAVAVNHEINNPLMVILGQAQLILRTPGLPSEIRTRVIKIEQECLRIRETTARLAQMVEPVSVDYLQGEKVRMLDIKGSVYATEEQKNNMCTEPRSEAGIKPGADSETGMHSSTDDQVNGDETRLPTRRSQVPAEGEPPPDEDHTDG